MRMIESGVVDASVAVKLELERADINSGEAALATEVLICLEVREDVFMLQDRRTTVLEWFSNLLRERQLRGGC